MFVSEKPYVCSRCGAKRKISTNHFGQVYDRCNNWPNGAQSGGCSWKNPMEPLVVWECAVPEEEMPEGAWVPRPWTIAKLGDVADIKKVR